MKHLPVSHTFESSLLSNGKFDSAFVSCNLTHKTSDYCTRLLHIPFVLLSNGWIKEYSVISSMY